jgi:small subunit ribosomal protein S17
MKKKGTGSNIKQPESKCSDGNCPFHGALSIRGRFLTGKVASDKMSKSVIVSWDRKVFVPKFERYEKRRSKVNAHNPDCIDAKKGDLVKISECRPLSKTKHFVVVEILGKESKRDILKTEAVQEDGSKERRQPAPSDSSEPSDEEAKKKTKKPTKSD